MNTRRAIQPSTTPAVLSLSISPSKKRFAAGLSNGLCIFRTENCLSTHRPTLPFEGGIGIAEALDDRYVAFVPNRKVSSAYNPHVVIIWDAVADVELNKFDFQEPILGIRLIQKWMAVVLSTRTILFQHQQVHPQNTRQRQSAMSPTSEKMDPAQYGVAPVPNLVHSLYQTAPNTHSLSCLRSDLLVLPAQSVGQVQLVSLKPGSSSTKRVIRAHNSSLRAFALSDDGTLLATASIQGTLIRVYDIETLDQVAEFRRGVDHAIIQGLAFSPGNRWVASTSDKGTLHVFDLRPPNAEELAATRDREARERQRHRSQSYATHRLSGTNLEKESLSGLSGGRSSPAPSTAIGTGAGTGFHGSVQEYYGLRAPPPSATPLARDAAVSMMAALKASSLAPKVFKDLRSATSAPFYTGNDSQHWQGSPATSWTMTPDGTRKRIRNPVPPLPNDPTGRPPKGLLTFVSDPEGGSDDAGGIIYVLGGGSDARWEMFELLPMTSEDGVAVGSWVLVNKGFRRYLTKQFAD